MVKRPKESVYFPKPLHYILSSIISKASLEKNDVVQTGEKDATHKGSCAQAD